ncbi:MAG: hypothetical protein NZ853_00710 [Leptospiraceae bacterium]|nr:hypothetical protein [Leptospiraceae bacterium]MDW7976251.1 FliG C-terminal domain-containing protein [Leptospiraceae bacterium]
MQNQERKIDFTVADTIVDNTKNLTNPKVYNNLKSSLKSQGKEKAAKLLIALGPDLASRVLKELNENEIQLIIEEMIRIKKISEKEKKEILREFLSSLNEETIITSGKEEAIKILEKVYPSDKSKIDKILKKAENKDIYKEIKTIENHDPKLVFSLLSNEHPQVVAALLSFLRPNFSAQILKLFPSDKRKEIILRIAHSSYVHPESLEKIIESLKEKIEKRSNEIYEELEGIQTAVSILNHLDRKYENEILDYLEEVDPELLEKIKSKLYTFEELEFLDFEELRILLSKFDAKIIATALLGMPEHFKRIFLNSLSQNKASDVIFELDTSSNVPLKRIHEARNLILQKAKELDNEGIITIKKDKDDTNF